MDALGLDLKLIIAQMINFGVLLVILSKFLYRPLIKMLDDRRAKAVEALKNSQKIEERLAALEQKEKDVLRQAQDKAEKEREDLIKIAREEKQEIIEEAKIAAKRESEKGIAQIRAEEDQAAARVREKLSDELVTRVLQKLSRQKLPLLKQILK